MKRYTLTILALLCALVIALTIVRGVRDALRLAASNPLMTVEVCR